jgi:hypothetical protein
MLQSAGVAPVIEKELFSRLLREGVKGLDDENYEAMDEELDRVLDEGAELRKAGGMNVMAEGGSVIASINGSDQYEGSADGGTGSGPTAVATDE